MSTEHKVLALKVLAALLIFLSAIAEACGDQVGEMFIR